MCVYIFLSDDIHNEIIRNKSQRYYHGKKIGTNKIDAKVNIIYLLFLLFTWKFYCVTIFFLSIFRVATNRGVMTAILYKRAYYFQSHNFSVLTNFYFDSFFIFSFSQTIKMFKKKIQVHQLYNKMFICFYGF